MAAIFEAAREGNEEEVKRLLDADPLLLEREDDRGDRPLAWAASSGQLGVSRLLIERGANIDVTGCEGKTAIHYAVEEEAEEVVALLLDNGAHANSRDVYGFTPLMDACDNDHLDVVKMLVQHIGRQGVRTRSYDGTTALHCAAESGNDEMVRILLLAGADPTIRDYDGRTPRAFAENYYDIEFEEEHERCVAVFQVRPRDGLSTRNE
jgi:ankyrin repeat protein